MKPEYFKQAAALLDNCGARHTPLGKSVVPLYKGFVVPLVVPASASFGTGNVISYTKEIPGTVPWVMRAISLDLATLAAIYATNGQIVLDMSPFNSGIRLQIKLPSGRYLFGGNGVDVGQLFSTGSWRWLQDPEMLFEPGDKLVFSLYNTSGYSIPTITPVTLLLEGAYLYGFDGGQYEAPTRVSAMPRYQGTVNENILAPPWMSNEGIRTPQGFTDEYLIFSSDPVLTSWTLTAGAMTAGVQTVEVPIEPGGEFHVRRMLFDIQTSSTAVASVMGRIRSGEGNSLNDTEIDVGEYLNGAEFAADFVVNGGDTLYMDAFLADTSGTGTVTLQVHAEGYRRRPS